MNMEPATPVQAKGGQVRTVASARSRQSTQCCSCTRTKNPRIQPPLLTGSWNLLDARFCENCVHAYAGDCGGRGLRAPETLCMPHSAARFPLERFPLLSEGAALCSYQHADTLLLHPVLLHELEQLQPSPHRIPCR